MQDPVGQTRLGHRETEGRPKMLQAVAWFDGRSNSSQRGDGAMGENILRDKWPLRQNKLHILAFTLSKERQADGVPDL